MLPYCRTVLRSVLTIENIPNFWIRQVVTGNQSTYWSNRTNWQNRLSALSNQCHKIYTEPAWAGLDMNPQHSSSITVQLSWSTYQVGIGLHTQVRILYALPQISYQLYYYQRVKCTRTTLISCGLSVGITLSCIRHVEGSRVNGIGSRHSLYTIHVTYQTRALI